MQHVRTALSCRWTACALSRSRIFIAGKVSAGKWSRSESKRPALSSSAAASEANISSAASASGRSILCLKHGASKALPPRFHPSAKMLPSLFLKCRRLPAPPRRRFSSSLKHSFCNSQRCPGNPSGAANLAVEEPQEALMQFKLTALRFHTAV